MHNRNGLLKSKIELTSNGNRLTANHGLRYIPKRSVLKVSNLTTVMTNIAVDKSIDNAEPLSIC